MGGAQFLYAGYIAGLGLALIIATSASADELSLKCTPLVNTGAVSRDPVTEIDVVTEDRNWHVVHITESGAQYWRERQYAIRDNSSERSHAWNGTLISHPNLSMVGNVGTQNGKFDYTETIYDSNRGGAIVGMVRAICASNPMAASLQTTSSGPIAVAPDLTSRPPITVPMELNGGTFTVPVQINGAITLKFLVDSGASDVAIPADVASTLLRTGTTTNEYFIGNQQYTLADGKTIPSMTFRIRSLRIGDRVITDIKGSISPVEGSLLLGQSFLRRFRFWAMDNEKQTLILN